MGTGWKVGRLAGVELAIHPSLLVIAAIVTFSLAFQLTAQFPEWPAAQVAGCGEVWAFAGGNELFDANVQTLATCSDAAGNPTKRTTPRGSTGYTYDPRGLLTKVDYSDATPDATFGYDDAGRMTARAN